MKNTWTCTPTERRGFILVISLILLGNAAGRWMPVVWKSEPPPAELARWEAILDYLEAQDSMPAPAPLFPFDPNTASEQNLVDLGLPAWLAARILRYRKAGGQFRIKADLKRIYGFPDSAYQRLEAYIQLPDRISGQRKQARTRKVDQNEVVLQPRSFDPNTVRVEELAAMGLPPQVAQTWANYRRAGGKFFRPEDLDKLYGLRPEWAAALKPYVRLNSAPSTASSAGRRLTVDVNSASAEDWQQLRGIGKVYSQRILRFREALGGFSQLDQIADTYGLPDSTFQSIRPSLVMEKGVYRKLPINTATAGQLAGHPYLSKRQARVVVAYREQHGPFRAIEDINKTMVLSEENYRRLEPYLSLE